MTPAGIPRNARGGARMRAARPEARMAAVFGRLHPHEIYGCRALVLLVMLIACGAYISITGYRIAYREYSYHGGKRLCPGLQRFKPV